MSYFTRMPHTTFGSAWNDGSISLLRNEYEDTEMHPEPNGHILVQVSEYSSDITPIFYCLNEASVQYFIHRFSPAIDTWHDIFTPGPIAKFTLKHRPAGGDGDIDAQLTSEIEFGFYGWAAMDDEEVKLFTSYDEVVDFINRPATPRTPLVIETDGPDWLKV